MPLTISIGRDVQVGEAFGPWVTHTLVWTCTRVAVDPHGGHQRSNDDFHVKTYFYLYGHDKGLYAADPRFRVYHGYNEQIGYIAEIVQTMGQGVQIRTPINTKPGYWAGFQPIRNGVSRKLGDSATFRLELRVRLVKLNNEIWKVSHPVDIPTLYFDIYSSKYHTATPHDTPHWWPQGVHISYVKTSIHHSSAACVTPDVNVPLGTTYTAALQNGGAGPLKDFNLRFEQCPQDMTTVDYRLHSVPQQPVTNGILPLVTQTDSASGVGVQVLEADGTTPVTFDAWRHLNAYDPAQSNATYDVPLKARIKRTTGALEGGQVKALMEMEVKYK